MLRIDQITTPRDTGIILRNAKVCSHVAEIRSALAEGIIQREITNRNARVGLLQDLVD